MQKKLGELLPILREKIMIETENNLFDEFIECAPVGYVVFGSEGQIRQINPVGAAMLGEKQEAIAGLWFGSFVSEPDQLVFTEFLHDVFHTTTKQSCELGINNKLERLLFVQLEGKTDADRQECRAILMDVTESRIVRESMVFNESKYRALFENLSVAFSFHQILTDTEGQVCDSIILEANNAYGILVGKPLADLVGRKKSDVGLFSISNDFNWKTLYDRGLSSGHPVTLEYYSEALNQWFLIITFVPSIHHMAFIYLNTTETKKREQIMIESEKRYRSLVRDANAIIMILNNYGEITFMNEFGLGFLGYRGEELIGKNIFGTIVRLDKLKNRDPRQLFKLFQTKIKRHHRGIVESISFSGHRVLVDWTVQECRDFIGEEARYVAVGIDAIDAKRTQRDAEKQVDRQRRRSIFNDGINRNLSQAELVGAARQLGIALAPPYVVVLLDIGNCGIGSENRPKLKVEHQIKMDNLTEILNPWDTGAAWRSNEGIAVVRSLAEGREQLSGKLALGIADEMIKRVLQFGFLVNEVRAGVSHSTHPMQSIAELYDQARAALSYGPMIESERFLHHWDELGFYQFIVNNLQTGMAQQFVQDQLGPLLQMNRSGAREDLLDTLKEIVSGNSAQLIAERLHIHRQTLVFRKKGLEKLLGVDLDSAEVVLNIAIALKMMSMADKDRSRQSDTDI